MEVEGLQNLFDKMDALPYTMQKILIVRALRQGGKPVEEDMKRLAPDDVDTSGSRIEDNVRTIVTEQTADGAIAVITVKPWNYVARFAELGTIKQGPTPFMRPAFDNNVVEALRIIGEELGSSIERELAKR